MKALQLLFGFSFAMFALVIPYVVFSFIQGQGSNIYLIIFIGVIFAINAFFIIRKARSLKKDSNT
jgi:hypothetical protein